MEGYKLYIRRSYLDDGVRKPSNVSGYYSQADTIAGGSKDIPYVFKRKELAQSKARSLRRNNFIVKLIKVS